LSALRGHEGKRAAENRPKRLFSKNTGVCKVAQDDV
jgi:hypothetical protein